MISLGRGEIIIKMEKSYPERCAFVRARLVFALVRLQYQISV